MQEDYFNLTGIGFYATNTGMEAVPEAPIIKTSPNSPSYTTYYAGKPTTLGYTFLYWNSYAFPNPVKGGVPYLGVPAINGFNLVVDTVEITNNYTSTIAIDLIKASPVNVVENGLNIIPPVQIARYVINANDTISLNKDDINIKLSNHVAQTQANPYYTTGDALAVAFPNSVKTTTTKTTTITTTHPTSTTTTETTTITTTITTTTEYGIYNVNIDAVAHYE